MVKINYEKIHPFGWIFFAVFYIEFEITRYYYKKRVRAILGIKSSKKCKKIHNVSKFDRFFMLLKPSEGKTILNMIDKTALV